ncbi:MAG: tRNA pseudouridine(38-40) synthase TruA [Desulfobacteraceae bacterium]|nr:MAG: tRNA pseudouridine(38-40) synthase TruA [Desulfobacteraceae bacterium]
MNTNFKLIIEYDGTAYNGWQRQKNGRTIQGEIEKALLVMTGRSLTLTGAGRTDAGVHALGQVANFICDTRLEPEAFYNGLNSLLPGDIVIKECAQVHEKFHSRYDAKRKIYNYRILNRAVPAAVGRDYGWHIRKPLLLEAMQASASCIAGTHDFKAFEGTGSPRKSTVRTVFRAEIHKNNEDLVIFEIEADGFLRFMVRNIVGTLVCAGLGKISSGDVKEILGSKDRSKACATAPAHGLFLMEVKY